jgi:hypothetical protein
MDSINYAALMHDAMRELIKNILRQVQKNGLPGDHHFYITVNTQEPGVEMAQWLRDTYPDDMTIVMQHWFDNLDVQDEGFAITLNFGNAPEPLYIPYAALRTFADPSVEFGLRFEAQGDADHALDVKGSDDEKDNVSHIGPDDFAAPVDHDTQDDTQTEPETSADVVQLDRFR